MKKFFYDLEQIEEILGIVFHDKKLLAQAFIHSSFCNEHKGITSNERLEFLGDSILNLLIAHFLFLQFPQLDEGSLTHLRAQLVSAEACSGYLKQLKLEDYLLVGKGEKEIKQSMISDLFEAIIGAIYVDQGFLQLSSFFFQMFEKQLIEKVKSPEINWKASFQDYMQKKIHLTPEYRVLEEKGPCHKKEFLVAVFVGEKKCAEAWGESKKKAEMHAAKNALQNIENSSKGL